MVYDRPAYHEVMRGMLRTAIAPVLCDGLGPSFLR